MADKPVIAVCEDDADIRELLAAYLTTSGFTVETTGDAIGLNDVLSNGSVALVVLDWVLPGENGLAVCRRLRAAGGPPIGLADATALVEALSRPSRTWSEECSPKQKCSAGIWPA